MKILLVGINAKYIHTNLGIYSLKKYAREYGELIELKEFTINHYLDDILESIYKSKPDFIGFSCYIWNIGMVKELCVELRKVLPKVTIWLGGPEVSYDAKVQLETLAEVDGIVVGEGEETFRQVVEYYVNNYGNHRVIQNQTEDLICQESAEEQKDFRVRSLRKIQGIVYRNRQAVEAITGEYIESSRKDRVLETTIFENEKMFALDFNTIPFPYDCMEDFENKIIYYESSRGCPYSCSYCLSSIEKNVRMRDISLVKQELDLFLRLKVPQVKFVDRTFNCDHKHAMAIWSFIKEKDNGVTNFHFEIAADSLREDELKLLNSMRVGLVQLEIGVQSTNVKTLEAIHRKIGFEDLKIIVKKIQEGQNIHQHLDLIAGLPYEDYKSFACSFNDVYALAPDQLQLGFLKVLKGSRMHKESKEHGIIYKDRAPYEVLSTDWISYDELIQLKSVEEMVEIYYNSGQFYYTIKYMEHFFDSPFELYFSLGQFYEKHGYAKMQHARMRRYEILLAFMEERKGLSHDEIHLPAFKSILVHDLYLRENLKNPPAFSYGQEEYRDLYRDFYRSEEKIREVLQIDKDGNGSGQYKQYLHLEHYSYDVERVALTGIVVSTEETILYDYYHRNPLNHSASSRVLILK